MLVGHNVAFDMRFLKLKEARAACASTSRCSTRCCCRASCSSEPPTPHGLEAIAARLGVHVIGRHTALGDALVTAEVFLKMLPLLAEQGILTLGEAREAAEGTYYARVKY